MCYDKLACLPACSCFCVVTGIFDLAFIIFCAYCVCFRLESRRPAACCTFSSQRALRLQPLAVFTFIETRSCLQASDELDWPQCSWSTGFQNTSACPPAALPMLSVYQRLRQRNLCIHRDYQVCSMSLASLMLYEIMILLPLQPHPARV